MGQSKHKQEDIKTKGDCCFNHIIGLPKKDDVEKPLFDYQKLLYDSLLTPDFHNPQQHTFKYKHLWVNKAIIQLYGVVYPKWGRARTVSENIKKEIEHDEIKNKDTLAFEIQIPQNVKRSFNAKHSEYYWLLETHVDLSGAPDIYAKRIIQVA